MGPIPWSWTASLALLAGLAAADTCDLSFSIISVAQQPSLFGSISHEVSIKDADDSKPKGEIFVGCTLSYFGKGCTWQRNGNSDLAGYTVSHHIYSAFYSNPDDVTVTGNDCDETKLLCNGRPVTITPIDNPDDGSVIYIYTAQTDCAVERPDGSEPSPSIGEVVDIYNAAQLVELPAPADGSAMPTTVSDAQQPAPLSCSSNGATDCYDAHWLCTDGVASVAYPSDAPVESSMTAPPDASPTLLANRCPDSTNPSPSSKQCAVEVGVAVNRDEGPEPLIAITMLNENDEQVGELINVVMDIDQTLSTGGLGPDVAWTLKVNPLPQEWPVDLDFTYDVESWNWLGCEFMSQSNLGRDTILESRRCEFPCHG